MLLLSILIQIMKTKISTEKDKNIKNRKKKEKEEEKKEEKEEEKKEEKEEEKEEYIKAVQQILNALK